MGSSGGKAPKPQDPLPAIQLQARYNRVGQRNPFGSALYTGNEQDGYNVETTLSPQMQALVDRGQGLAMQDSQRYERPAGLMNLAQAIQGRVGQRYGMGGQSGGLPPPRESTPPAMEYDFQPQVTASSGLGGGKMGQGYAQAAPEPMGGVGASGGYMAKPRMADYSQAPQGAGPAAPGTRGIGRLPDAGGFGPGGQQQFDQQRAALSGIGAAFGTGGGNLDFPSNPASMFDMGQRPQVGTGQPRRDKPTTANPNQPSPGVPPGP